MLACSSTNEAGGAVDSGTSADEGAAGASQDSAAPLSCGICPSDFPNCNPSTGKCVVCWADAHCAGEGVCNEAAGICVRCHSDSDCKASRPRCNVAAGSCRPECSAAKPCSIFQSCAPEGYCVDCLSSETCSNYPPTTHCDPDARRCVACLTSADCKDPAKPVCGIFVWSLENFRTCTECAVDSDCAGGRRCLMPVGICRDCRADSDCPDGKLCTPKMQCEARCSTNADCPDKIRKVCNSENGLCLECTTDSDCTSEEPICQKAIGACRGCLSDLDCKDPGKPRCNVQSGACQQD